MASKKCPQCGMLNWEQAAKCDCGYQFPPMPEDLTVRPGKGAIKPSPEIQTASNWYRWLWISPLFTIPTMLGLDNLFPKSSTDFNESDLWLSLVVSILGSALWHLILLYPASSGKTEFVRWHGRQALLLAGVRTTLAFVTLLISLRSDSIQTDLVAVSLGLLLLVLVWLTGNLWGQGQARRGDCSLMRWTGHGAGLPRPLGLEVASPESSTPSPDRDEIDRLVGVIRFNTDPEQRRATLAELERLGMVEAL